MELKNDYRLILTFVIVYRCLLNVNLSALKMVDGQFTLIYYDLFSPTSFCIYNAGGAMRALPSYLSFAS